jgi:hypothetical protein
VVVSGGIVEVLRLVGWLVGGEGVGGITILFTSVTH